MQTLSASENDDDLIATGTPWHLSVGGSGRCSLRLLIKHIIMAGHCCKDTFVVCYSHLSATTNTV